MIPIDKKRKCKNHLVIVDTNKNILDENSDSNEFINSAFENNSSLHFF